MNWFTSRIWLLPRMLSMPVGVISQDEPRRLKANSIADEKDTPGGTPRA